MRKKIFGKKIALAGMTITLVEETTVSAQSSQHGISIYASCEPLGIIIESVEKSWALDINGESIDPGALKSMIACCNKFDG